MTGVLGTISEFPRPATDRAPPEGVMQNCLSVVLKPWLGKVLQCLLHCGAARAILRSPIQVVHHPRLV